MRKRKAEVVTNCAKCGAALFANEARCRSCGYDPAASPGALPPQSLEARVSKLEGKPKKGGILKKILSRK